LTEIRIALVTAREALLDKPQLNKQLQEAIQRLDHFEVTMAKVFCPRQD
jgi:hypothetical protein